MILDTLKKTCSTCTQCGLSDTRTQVVFGVGPCPCQVMLIGEAPGEQEDVQGEPFVGRAGKLLDQILASVHLDRHQNIYIANTVKCRPPNNRKPLLEEMQACHVWLEKQIEILNPKLIVLCGSVAMTMAFPDERLTISKQRGQWKQWKNRDTMGVFHPSYLLRNPSREPESPKWHTWQDFKEIRNALDYYEKCGT